MSEKRTLLLRLEPALFDALTRLAYEGKTTKTALIKGWIAKADWAAKAGTPAVIAPPPRRTLPSFVQSEPAAPTSAIFRALSGE